LLQSYNSKLILSRAKSEKHWINIQKIVEALEQLLYVIELRE